MNTEGQMENRLWDYIDGTTTERALIEKLISENASWRQKYGELNGIHMLIQGAEPEQPSMRFTRNVMEHIAAFDRTPAAKNFLNNKIIWSIALFFMIAVTGFVVYSISQVGLSAGSNNNVAGIDLTAVDYNRVFNHTFQNGFAMLNVVLGLLFLDRFLAHRRRTIPEEG